MFKFDSGRWMENAEGVRKNVIVNTMPIVKPRDAIIGGALIAAGVGYLMYSSFKQGVVGYDDAILATQYDLGIIQGWHD